MTQGKDNLILIGMPGSGKSTVGIILAKFTSRDFVDTDVLIQTREKRTLQDIVDSDGHMALREIEERVLLSLTCENMVISTGGSAAYSHPAMTHLRKNGTVIFLQADLETLKGRILNYETRGLAKRPDQSLEDLFRERLALYTRYADMTVATSGLSQEEVCGEIMKRLPE